MGQHCIGLSFVSCGKSRARQPRWYGGMVWYGFLICQNYEKFQFFCPAIGAFGSTAPTVGKDTSRTNLYYHAEFHANRLPRRQDICPGQKA